MDVARHGWGWLLAGALLVSTSAAAQDPSAESAKTWAEDTEAIEAFLKGIIYVTGHSYLS